MFTVLAEAGIDVYAYDMHGHGLSEPQNEEGRVCIVSADHLVEDAEDILDGVVEPALRGAAAAPPPQPAAAATADPAAAGRCADVTAHDTSAAAAEMAGAAAAQVAADIGDAAGSVGQAVADGVAATSAAVLPRNDGGDSSTSLRGDLSDGAVDSCASDSEAAGDAGPSGRRVKLFGVAHSLGGGVLSLLESTRPGTFAVRPCVITPARSAARWRMS